jgi:hypothetical protein
MASYWVWGWDSRGSKGCVLGLLVAIAMALRSTEKQQHIYKQRERAFKQILKRVTLWLFKRERARGNRGRSEYSWECSLSYERLLYLPNSATHLAFQDTRVVFVRPLSSSWRKHGCRWDPIRKSVILATGMFGTFRYEFMLLLMHRAIAYVMTSARQSFACTSLHVLCKSNCTDCRTLSSCSAPGRTRTYDSEDPHEEYSNPQNLSLVQYSNNSQYNALQSV